MTRSNVCPECGAALPGSSPGGYCPACLLKRGLETNTAGYSATEAPAARWMPPAVEELAGRFPELQITHLIGRGGMGAVYQARQKALDRVVALKILPPEMAHDPAFAERFAREAQAMARLNHPHIVTIHEFGERAGWYYFLMEYVDGVSLRGLLDSGHVSPKEALAIVPQICDALQYAHDQGIVHRDIKPENILLSKQGQVKIADFGLAKLMGRTTANAGTAEKVMGTPQYMAPEQLDRPADVDHRADIYSLGVVFYQMLTGELPVGKFAPPSRKVQIDVRLDEVVLRALEKEPAKRYQQVSQVKTEVETIVGTPGMVLPAASPLQLQDMPADTSPHFSRKAIVGALWAAEALLAFIWLTFHIGERVPRMRDMSGLETLGFVITQVGFLLGFLAFPGTTILGGIALYQIRHSRGRLCGLWLALLDTLLFPLLAVNGLIVAGLHWEIRNRVARHIPSGASFVRMEYSIIQILLFVVLCGLVDFEIIPLAWRAVTKPANGVAPSSAVPPRRRIPRLLDLLLASAAVLVATELIKMPHSFVTGTVVWASPATRPMAPVAVLAARAYMGDIHDYVGSLGSIGPGPVTQTAPGETSTNVTFYLPEEKAMPLIKEFRAGKSFPVTVFDRQGKAIIARGTVAHVGDAFDAQTGTLPCTAIVRAEPDVILLSNQSVSVKVLMDTKRGVVIVPNTAVYTSSSSRFVYLIQPDRALVRRVVTTGYVEWETNKIEIKSGLSSSDLVVDGTPTGLVEGAKVSYTLPATEATQPGAGLSSTTKPSASSQEPILARAVLNNAEKKLELAKMRVKAGVAPYTMVDVLKAQRERDVAAARVRGDTDAIPGIEFKYADEIYGFQRKRLEWGVITQEEFLQAEMERNLAAAATQPKAANNPGPVTAPTSAPSVDSHH
jgi:hypothetical protein